MLTTTLSAAKVAAHVTLTTLVLAFASPASVRADEPFKPYVECIVATRDCSKGSASFMRAGVTDLVVLLANRAGQDGFYVFAPEDAYFHALPPPPPPQAARVAPTPTFWNLYGFIDRVFHREQPKPNPYIHYKIEAGIHEVVYAVFKRQESGEVVLESASTTAGPGGTSYLTGAGKECHADAESRDRLVQEALKRVSSVHETYMSSPEPEKNDVMNEVNITGHEAVRTFFNRAACLKGLEGCMGAAELGAKATAQKGAFAP